jgi:hypothetical protein
MSDNQELQDFIVLFSLLLSQLENLLAFPNYLLNT